MDQVSELLFRGISKPHKLLKIGLATVKVGLNPFKIGIYLVELFKDSTFWSHVNNEKRKAQKEFSDPKLGGWMLDFPSVLIYPIVRMVRPEVVIETGVGPGGSSALILNALNRNNKGHLYSIDLPGYDAIIYPQIGRCYNIHVPPGYEVGWLVPSWVRNRWTLLLGDSKQRLPELLSSLTRVDIFLHDSLHTDEHILFELTSVFQKLSKNGLLLADDVNEYWSLAFVDFCKRYSVPYVILGNRLGIAIKRE